MSALRSESPSLTPQGDMSPKAVLRPGSETAEESVQYSTGVAVCWSGNQIGPRFCCDITPGCCPSSMNSPRALE